MSDKTTETKTVETDKGLTGTTQKETHQVERESEKPHHPETNPEPDQSGGAASDNPNKSDFGSGGGRISG